MSRVDARLREMQFLAWLDREGQIEVRGPYDGSAERQMLISLIDQGYINGVDSESHNRSGPSLLEQAIKDKRVADMWRLLSPDEKYARVTVRIGHKGRVRLSELEQQLKTGRDRDDTGLLWAKRHLVTDLAIALLSARDNAPLSVVFLDMNGLKAINDECGHAVGDDAIRAFFQSIVSTLGQHGEAYRNGGDEAVVVLPNATDERAGTLLGAFVQQLGKEVLRLPDGATALTLTASCGSVSTTNPAENAEALLKRADEVQYRAKRKSKERPARVSAIAVGEGEGEVTTHPPGA
ncbi:GGDEF domain-containing protein [Sorangium sp. So ce204]|uniref:GGDEF domain-containing protein n=1 Tax=Sorangium sp. So ce204 TaxID=3133288 RepID=UPI003F5FB7DF